MSDVSFTVFSDSLLPSLSRDSFAAVVFFSSATIVGSLSFPPEEFLALSDTTLSFSYSISVVGVAHFASISVYGFFTQLWVSAGEELSGEEFLVGLSLSGHSLWTADEL